VGDFSASNKLFSLLWGEEEKGKDAAFSFRMRGRERKSALRCARAFNFSSSAAYNSVLYYLPLCISRKLSDEDD